MKRTLHYCLSRRPSLYRAVLRATGSRNAERQTLLHLVKDGNTVLDIGANRGDMTVLFSHIVGSRGHVHAFEPVPPTFAALQQRAAQECRFENVTFNNAALGDTRGTKEIHVPAGDFGQASLRTHATGSWERPGHETFHCEIRTLDEYVAEARLSRIDFIKIDVEGAELLALRGGRRTLEQWHPPIQLEFFARWTKAFGYGASELVVFLQACGYRHFYRDDLSPFVQPESDIPAIDEPLNVICSVTPLS